MIFFAPLDWFIGLFFLMLAGILFVAFPIPMLMIVICIIWGLIALSKKGGSSDG